MIQIDMPMPERCGVCFAMHTDDIGLESWCGIDETARDIYTEEINTKRPDWCPLKEQENCENCAIAIEDRQPVVRCKDCEHATMTSDGKMCKYCAMDTDDFGDQREVYHNADWFCADGERREDDG